ncbi:ABC transporter permease [Rhodobacteraceae bacterium KMM 6894]|nr:ABC transporter permease [Rhodobacteraceae bacterium KMM 6894]
MTDTAPNAPVLAADGRPLKRSLSRALRVQKMRALALIAPLLIFVFISFIMPIGDMLFRSVENQIVENTLPYTVQELSHWDGKSDALPDEQTYQAFYFDIFLAAELKRHTRLGSRLNYESSGMSSLFRQTGRKLDDVAKDYRKLITDFDPVWKDGATWLALISGGAGAEPSGALYREQLLRVGALNDMKLKDTSDFEPSTQIAQILPITTRNFTAQAVVTELVDNKDLTKAKPVESLYLALAHDLTTADLSGYDGPFADELRALQSNAALPAPDFTAIFADIDEDWVNLDTWRTIETHSSTYTAGYFLNAVDYEKTPDGIKPLPDDRKILIQLFIRTLIMSMIIMGSCILLGYPVAWILANVPTRQANMLMILVLLPFWTSLLVRTSAWKVMLQQQGVINDVLVWIGLVADDARLVMINNQFGTIVAMTHILLPFMILPMYSVMQTINPTYLRAAKSLGATNWTAFWRVYFPQSIPGIGAGSILVFILSIGYYITPEIVGGTKGVFISNRIAYHISSSLNWGLAAALGTILLAVVLGLYWCYDKIVGIDNVKLG